MKTSVVNFLDNKFYLSLHANMNDCDDRQPFYEHEHNVQKLKEYLKEKEKAHKDAQKKQESTRARPAKQRTPNMKRHKL